MEIDSYVIKDAKDYGRGIAYRDENNNYSHFDKYFGTTLEFKNFDIDYLE